MFCSFLQRYEKNAIEQFFRSQFPLFAAAGSCDNAALKTVKNARGAEKLRKDAGNDNLKWYLCIPEACLSEASVFSSQGALRVFKHIVNIVIWTLVSLYALVVVLLHIPSVQRFVGSGVAGELSAMLGTEVSVGRVELGLFNRLIVDNVLVRDQQGHEMVRSARLAVKIELMPLGEGRISVASVQVFGTHVSLYRRSASAKPNWQFVLDSLASEDTTSAGWRLDLRVNSLIMRQCSFRYDRLDAPQTPGKLNADHLSVDGVSAYAKLNALTPDTIDIEIRRLAAKERSGLAVERLSFAFAGNRSGCRLDGFRLEMPASTLAVDRLEATYRSDSSGVVMPTLEFDGRLGPTRIALSDLAFLAPALRKVDTAVGLSASFHGTGTLLYVPEIRLFSESEGLDLTADGWVRNWQNRPLWHLNVGRLRLPEKALALVLRHAAPQEKSVAAAVSALGDVSLRGTVGASAGEVVAATCRMATAAGQLDLDFSLSGDKTFAAEVETEGFDVGRIVGGKLGTVAARLKASGRIGRKEVANLGVRGTVASLFYNGYDFKNISVDCKIGGESLSGRVEMNDPNATLAVEGGVDKSRGGTSVEVKSDVTVLRPKAVNLTDRWGDAAISMAVGADFFASGLNDANGRLSVRGLSMVSPEDTFRLDSAVLTSGFADGRHFLTMRSDFGRAELNGVFEYNTLPQSFVNFIGDKLPTLPGLPKVRKASTNNFEISADITDSRWIEKLLGVPLRLAEPFSLSASVDDARRDISLNCRVGNFSYDNGEYRNGSVVIKSVNDTLHCEIGVDKLNAGGQAMNLRLNAKAADNKLAASLVWDNKAEERFSGEFNTVSQFFRDGAGRQVASVSVLPSHINIGSAVWSVKPSSVVYSARNIAVNNFAIEHKKQHIIVNGRATESAADSLTVDLRGVDVGYVLNLVDFHSVEFSGLASGTASVRSLFGDVSAGARLEVDNFRFQDGRMGVLHAGVDWNRRDNEVVISAVADDGPDAKTFIDGYVSLKRKYIDLGIKADGTHIDFLESFTGSFMGGIQGQTTGNLRVLGELKKINLVGSVAVNGELTLLPTNCKYYLRGDTINFVPNEIIFPDAPIYDIRGNRATVSGSLHHSYLKNLTYDIRVDADNLLAYNTADFGEDSFYGTVFASGSVGVRGRSGAVDIDIDVRPRPNSTFVYNVASPDAIADQKFISWNDAARKASDSLALSPHAAPAPEEEASDIHINFLIDCTPDMTVRLLMDSRTDDYITLNGSGTLRASYYNKGDFSMFGTYSILYGTYGITIQDILKKNFIFNEGSSITFGGNPYYSALDLQAVYTVNGVSLSDLNVGNSFTNNTIRVNCIMNIGGQPQKPEITFDLDMPTVSSDEKQMIRSIINSEDEMNQQVLYLLGIGRFYPQGANNSAAQSEQQSQTSLAMHSLLSGTISTQINNVLSSVIQSNNWNFGANISTGDEGWNNAEYEGLLSGRLLNNRLLINGQFGYRDNAATTNTSSFIGDFDIRYLLKPNGNLSVRVYNQTNDRYFTKSSLNTQGVGLIMKKDFDGIRDLLNIKRKKKRGGK